MNPFLIITCLLPSHSSNIFLKIFPEPSPGMHLPVHSPMLTHSFTLNKEKRRNFQRTGHLLLANLLTCVYNSKKIRKLNPLLLISILCRITRTQNSHLPLSSNVVLDLSLSLAEPSFYFISEINLSKQISL